MGMVRRQAHGHALPGMRPDSMYRIERTQGVDGSWGGRMAYRFEFDPVNRILLVRIEGPLTEELATELYGAIRKYAVATDARAGIWDFSSVTEVALSAEFIRYLASQEPAMPDATRHPRFMVAPTAVAFGLSRMFQILGGATRPLLKVVHSVDQALVELGVQSPQFKSLE